MSLFNSLNQTNLGFGGAQPPSLNPNPLGPNGQTCLNVSNLDLGYQPTPYDPEG